MDSTLFVSGNTDWHNTIGTQYTAEYRFIECASLHDDSMTSTKLICIQKNKKHLHTIPFMY